MQVATAFSTYVPFTPVFDMSGQMTLANTTLRVAEPEHCFIYSSFFFACHAFNVNAIIWFHTLALVVGGDDLTGTLHDL